MNSADQIFYQIIDRTHASPSGKENQYSGLCPAHDDQSPSLSITKKPDKVLVVVQRKLDKPFESVMYRQGGTNEKKKKELSSRRKSGNLKAPLGRRRIRIVNM